MKKVKDSDGEDFDIEEMVQRMITTKGGGDAMKTLEALVSENYELRGKNRELRLEVTTASAKVPEGARVLTADEVKQFDLYLSLGKPETIGATLTQHGELVIKHEDMVRNNTVRSAADIAGYKHTVLGDLVKVHNLQLEVGERDDKGIKKPAVFVKEGNQSLPLEDVIKSRYADYVPALQLTTQGQPGAGVPWVPQSGGGATPPDKSVAKEYIGKTYGNPFATANK